MVRDPPFCYSMAELIYQSWVSSYTQRPHTDLDQNVKKMDTVLNDEASEIERDMCAFGLIGVVPQFISNRYEYGVS